MLQRASVYREADIRERCGGKYVAENITGFRSTGGVISYLALLFASRQQELDPVDRLRRQLGVRGHKRRDSPAIEILGAAPGQFRSFVVFLGIEYDIARGFFRVARQS